MENTQHQGNFAPQGFAPNADVKKTWIEPSITEISRFAILGGPNAGKAEGSTLDGSV